MTDLAIPPGVVRGPTSNMTPGKWWDSNLVRWRAGTMQPVGGWSRILTSPLASTPRCLHGWRNHLDNRVTAVGCDGHLYVNGSDGLLDITPTVFTPADVPSVEGGYGTWDYGEEDYGDGREAGTPSGYANPFRFSLDNFGTHLLALSSADGKLMYWDPSASMTQAVVVATAPTGNNAMGVTDERHVVLLKGRDVMWSSRESYTDWDFASLTNTAGTLPAQTQGTLRAMCNVREGMLIFSETDVFLLRFVGDPFIYSLDKIGEGVTLIGPEAIAAFNGRAIWRGREGFYSYDAGYIKPLPSDVGDYLDRDMDASQSFRMHMSNSGVFPEVWGWYPSAGNAECDKYFIYNYEEGWWAVGTMSRTCALGAGTEQYPYAGGSDGYLYQHETGDAMGSHDAGDIYAESGAVKVPGLVSTVTQFIPDSEIGPEKTAFTFYTRMTMEAAEVVKGPYYVRSDGYMDVMFTARSMRVRVQAREAGFWTIGSPEFEAKTRGRR
jgi:hypothetical protein